MKRARELIRWLFSRQRLLLALPLLPSLAILLYGLDLPHLGF